MSAPAPEDFPGRPDLAELLADLEQLVRCESPSKDLAAVGRSADLIAEIGTRRLGVAPDRIEVDGCAHLRWRFGPGPNRVLILAHHDTVWPIGSWTGHPWSLDDGVLRGPGTVDMKAGLVQAIHALSGLLSGGVDLTGVCLLVTGDEEIGSPTSRALIEDEAGGCVACFVLEGAGSAGALKTGRKGTSAYRFEITGRAAHAGIEPEKGINAGVELSHLILAVAGMGVPETGTTVTPTVAAVGTTTNTVPAAAFLEIDVRVSSQAEQDRVDDQLRSVRPTLPGAVLTVSGGPNRPPMEPTSGAALFARAHELSQRHGWGALTQTTVGGASDGNFTAGIGVPTLDGLGAVGGGAHADDEHVLVDLLVPRTQLLMALLIDVLDDGRPPGPGAVTGVSGGRTNRDLLTQAGRAAAAAAARAGVQVRPLETLEQMTAACVVFDRVWDIGQDEVSEVQPALLRALGHGGNYLFGAYRIDTGELVGASVAFFTEPLGAAMHSHITGVLGDAAGAGVGGALKWHQRQWALERGLTRVTWTFDPLISRNAYFNLTRLGARAETYFVDFYGPMNDGPNRGQPTDRVQVGWDLAGPGVPPDGPELQIPPDAVVLLSVGPDGEPVAGRPIPGGADLAVIGIPDDIEAMRRSSPRTALAWRHALRGALALLMADRSWQISTFADRRDARAGWYVAERRLPTDAVGDGS